MADRHLIQVLNDFGKEFVQRIQDKIIEKDGIASGEMLNQMDFEVRKVGTQWILYLKHVDYFEYFDQGAAPHWPPQEPIKKWIETKPILPYADNNGKLPTVEQLTFLISRAMAGLSPDKSKKGGIEGRDVFEPTRLELLPKYEPLIAQAIADDFMEDYLGGADINEWNILKV